MAADLTQSFMGKHVEKIVLAAAVAIFVGALAWFVVMREPQDDLLNDVMAKVDRLEEKVKQEVTLETALSGEERVALSIGRKPTGVDDLEEAVTGEAPPYDVLAKWVPPLRKGKVVEPPKKHFYPPAGVLAVEQVRPAVGYGVTDGDVPRALASLTHDATTYRDIVWAGVVGKFDLTEQLEKYAQPYLEADRDPYILKQSPIIISRVEIRRRRVKPDGTTGEWETVTPAVPAEASARLPAPPGDNTDQVAGGQWFKGLLKAQAIIRRAPFYNVLSLGGSQSRTVDMVAGEVKEVRQPDATRFLQKQPAAGGEAGGEAKASAGESGPVTAAAKTEGGFVPPWLREQPTEKGPAETGPEEPAPAEREHVYATLWATDLGVEPGKTYQYQMRVAVANPVWSFPMVQPQEHRWTLEFVGPWSEPTEPVTIPELMDFYFVGTFGQRVNLELHRWIHGQWIIVPSVPSHIGAPVVYTKDSARIQLPNGKTVVKDVSLSPGVLVVDVIRDFPYQPKGGNRPIRTRVLVYADGQGTLNRRVEWAERIRSSKDRRERKQSAGGAE